MCVCVCEQQFIAMTSTPPPSLTSLFSVCLSVYLYVCLCLSVYLSLSLSHSLSSPLVAVAGGAILDDYGIDGARGSQNAPSQQQTKGAHGTKSCNSCCCCCVVMVCMFVRAFFRCCFSSPPSSSKAAFANASSPSV